MEKDQAQRALRTGGRVLCLLTALTIASSRAAANINLEWRPAGQTVNEGDTFDIGLYAVSDDPNDQSIAAMDVILVWDADVLELLGKKDTGPYAWLFSGFPDDSGLDGLNNTWKDGDALYQALARLGQPAYATPAGLLVTTMQFKALKRTKLNGTDLTIPEKRGRYTKSRVFHGRIPGKVVTGTLGSANVIVVCPNGCFGDVDGDCKVTPQDLTLLLSSWYLKAGDPGYIPGADLDGDDFVGPQDLTLLLSDWYCGAGP